MFYHNRVERDVNMVVLIYIRTYTYIFLGGRTVNLQNTRRILCNIHIYIYICWKSTKVYIEMRNFNYIYPPPETFTERGERALSEKRSVPLFFALARIQ